MSAYRELEARFRRLAMLGEAGGVLHWDLSVNMPPGGAEARAEQLATLKVLRHELLTDSRMVDLLAAAKGEGGDSDWRQANLCEMRRSWQHASAVPPHLVEALSRGGIGV